MSSPPWHLNVMCQIPAQTLWASPTADPVEVVTSRTWITQAGDPQDHAVEAGDIWWPRGQGRVVVQALDGWLVIMLSDRSSRQALEPSFELVDQVGRPCCDYSLNCIGLGCREARPSRGRGAIVGTLWLPHGLDPGSRHGGSVDNLHIRQRWKMAPILHRTSSVGVFTSQYTERHAHEAILGESKCGLSA